MSSILSDWPMAARFVLAFVAVLALIAIVAWVVRRLAANRLGTSATRGRQPRLAVIDAANVDGRRRLLIVRRDNVEHLLMVGGPNDLLVESNIVRAAGVVPREGARTAVEPGLRGTGPAVETAWPLQPLNEPAPPAPPTRGYRDATEEPWLAPQPGARPRPADSFNDLPPPRVSPDFGMPPAPPPVAAPIPRNDVRQETPRIEPARMPPAEPQPSLSSNLNDMASQLEAALRRTPAPQPTAEPRVQATDALAVSPEPKSEPMRMPFKPRSEPNFSAAPKAEPKPEFKFEPKAFEQKLAAKPEPRVEPKLEPHSEMKAEPKFDATPSPSAAPSKSFYDNLEEEMANLLGRPSGKP